MRDWGEATTVIGILQQITNDGGRVEFDNREGNPTVRVSSRGTRGFKRLPITGLTEPEVVKVIWSAWEEVR